MGQPIIRYRKTELYEQLVDDHEIFENYYDLLVFLAIVGYREDTVKRTNYTGSSSDGTNGEAGLRNVYSKDLYRTIMACLAFQDSGKAEALVDTDLQMEILAQYAAGGLEFAEQEFGEVAGDPADAIVNYIQNRQDDHSDVGGELQEIVESFDDQMLGLK